MRGSVLPVISQFILKDGREKGEGRRSLLQTELNGVKVHAAGVGVKIVLPGEYEMAHLLIDGYNLLGIFHKNLEKAREDLISRLERYSSLKGHDLTIVFDGWKEGQPFETKFKVGRVTVIYSRLGEKADSVIERILKERKRSWIVVSSDREVADSAWSMGYASISSQEFEGKIESSTLRGYFDELEEDIKRSKKGNPRQPNKRQKLKLAAIKKL